MTGSKEERTEEDSPIGYRNYIYDTLNPPGCQSEGQVQANPGGLKQEL